MRRMMASKRVDFGLVGSREKRENADVGQVTRSP